MSASDKLFWISMALLAIASAASFAIGRLWDADEKPRREKAARG